MKNTIQLTRIDQNEDFMQLAMEVGAQPQAGNNAIRLESAQCHGEIKKWHLDAGLYMRTWDFVLNKPVELVKEASPVFIANRGFSLFCILTPASVDMKSVNQHPPFSKIRERSFV